jgi:hypothetical protein
LDWAASSSAIIVGRTATAAPALAMRATRPSCGTKTYGDQIDSPVYSVTLP